MKKYMSSFVAFLFVLTSLVSHSQSFEKVDRLSMKIDQLSVRVIPASGTAIIVGRMDRGDSPIEVKAEQGTLTIRQNKTGSDRRQIEIQVPENVVLDITTNSGDITMEHVTGTFRVYSRKGDISANVSPTAASQFESESGVVKVKLFGPLGANLHVGAGSGRGTLDFSGYPLNAQLEMKSFYPTGTIKSPFEFKEVHISRSYGPDTVVKRLEMGDHKLEVSMETGGGTVQIIP